MSDGSKIEWTDSTWNIVTGCDEVSPGCDHCYAKTFAERWRGTPGHHFENGFDVTLRPQRMTLPLRWRKPRRVFVNSMSDLFHEAVPDEFIAKAFAVMAATPQHTYQVLTKRHGRMRSLLNSDAFREASVMAGLMEEWPAAEDTPWPLPNVWLGVSVEDQKWADIRIPALLTTPAEVKFLSCEPLLGPVDLKLTAEVDGCTCGTGPGGYYGMHEPGCGLEPGPHCGIDWVIIGGESGPGARPMDLEWAYSLIRQCKAGGAAAFVKQVGSVAAIELGPFAGRKGGNWEALPDGLRVRNFPVAPIGAAA